MKTHEDTESQPVDSSGSSACSSSHDLPATTDPMTILEREDHVDLGGGFSLGRREQGWMIYFRAKHVDAWIEERTDEYNGLRAFGTVKDALDVAGTLIGKPVDQWVNDAD